MMLLNRLDGVFMMVQLPNLGFNLLTIIQAMILKQGSLIAICLGGFIAFHVLRAWLHHEKTDLDDSKDGNPYGEWEDYLTDKESDIIHNGCDFDTEMKIRRRATARMNRAIARYEKRQR